MDGGKGVNGAWAAGVVGAVGVIGYLWWAERDTTDPYADDPDTLEREDVEGIHYVTKTTVGTTSEGVTYAVQERMFKMKDGSSESTSPPYYKPVRSAGSGGEWMNLGQKGVMNLWSYDEALTRATEDFERANAERESTGPIVIQEEGTIAGPDTTATEVSDSGVGGIGDLGPYANLQLTDYDMADKAAGDAGATLQTLGLDNDIDVLDV